jgi:3-phenylpropionate/trans-cinnamate dioxygenase ferredoxin component
VSGARRVCAVDDLDVGQAARFVVEEVPICVVRTKDGYHAIGDTCTHEDYSLAEGEVDLDACEIECWKHGSMFSLTTGEPTTFPATRAVPVFPVTLEGDDVMVVIP